MANPLEPMETQFGPHDDNKPSGHHHIHLGLGARFDGTTPAVFLMGVVTPNGIQEVPPFWVRLPKRTLLWEELPPQVQQAIRSSPHVEYGDAPQTGMLPLVMYELETERGRWQWLTIQREYRSECGRGVMPYTWPQQVCRCPKCCAVTDVRFCWEKRR